MSKRKSKKSNDLLRRARVLGLHYGYAIGFAGGDTIWQGAGPGGDGWDIAALQYLNFLQESPGGQELLGGTLAELAAELAASARKSRADAEKEVALEFSEGYLDGMHKALWHQE